MTREEFNQTIVALRSGEDKELQVQELWEAIRADVDRLTLRWTTKRPTREGWYGWRPDYDAAWSPILVRAAQDGPLYCVQFGGKEIWMNNMGGEWSDRPLPEPVAAPEPTGGEG